MDTPGSSRGKRRRPQHGPDVENIHFLGPLPVLHYRLPRGLMAIGISASVGLEIIKIDAATAAMLVGVFAIFNGVGRPIFGVLTDKLSPRNAALISFVLILVSSLGMLTAGPGSVMLYTLCFIGFWLVLGGWLAIAPTATTIFFGVKNYAKNYGLVFFAYGIGAILAASSRDRRRTLSGPSPTHSTPRLA